MSPLHWSASPGFFAHICRKRKETSAEAERKKLDTTEKPKSVLQRRYFQARRPLTSRKKKTESETHDPHVCRSIKENAWWACSRYLQKGNSGAQGQRFPNAYSWHRTVGSREARFPSMETIHWGMMTHSDNVICLNHRARLAERAMSRFLVTWKKISPVRRLLHIPCSRLKPPTKMCAYKCSLFQCAGRDVGQKIQSTSLEKVDMVVSAQLWCRNLLLLFPHHAWKSSGRRAAYNKAI